MEYNSIIDLDKMPLNPIEKVLKELYRCCPESSLPCSGTEMLERFNKVLGSENTPWMLDARDVRGVDCPIDSDNRKVQDLSYVRPIGKSLLTDINEELYMRNEWNVAVSRNYRYSQAVYHQHHFFEMIYVTAGSCELHFTNTSVTLKCGDLAIISSGQKHALGLFSDEVIAINFLIREKLFVDSFFSMLDGKDALANFFSHAIYGTSPLPFLIFHTSIDDELRFLTEMIYREYYSERSYNQRMMLAFVNLFFAQLLRNHEDHVELPEGYRPDKKFLYIIQYIQENYLTVTMDELETVFHYSKRHLSRILSEHTGMTLNQLVDQAKLGRAAKLLAVTELSIEDIIQVINYKSYDTFLRKFRERYHVSPVKYRKEHSK